MSRCTERQGVFGQAGIPQGAFRDLALCEYFVPKVKATLKGNSFESVDTVKQKDTVYMLTKNNFQHCFD